MKHFLLGFLFFYFLIPVPCLAAIDLTISNLTSKEDYYEVTAEVSGMSSSSATYVQGVFTSIESPKYFGFSLSKKGDWIVYDGSPEKTFVLDNFIELKNGVSQKIYLKPNYQDTDYLGPGKYFVKLKRYTASGSPSDYSNSIEIDLSYTKSSPTPSLTPTSVPKVATPTTTLSATTTQIVNHQITPKISQPTPADVVIPSSASLSQVPSREDPTPSMPVQVLASTSSNVNEIVDTITTTPESTTSSSFKIISDKNLFLIGVSIFSVSSFLLYFRLKNL